MKCRIQPPLPLRGPKYHNARLEKHPPEGYRKAIRQGNLNNKQLLHKDLLQAASRFRSRKQLTKSQTHQFKTDPADSPIHNWKNHQPSTNPGDKLFL